MPPPPRRFCLLRRAREGELPRRGKRGWPGPRPRRAAGSFTGFRPAGRGTFPDGKVPKGSPGDAAEANCVRQCRLTPGPPLRGLPLGPGRIFPARKNGVAGPNSRRATGPWVCKNCRCCGSTTAPDFAKPTLRVRFRRRGGPCGRPKAFPFRGRLPLSRGDGRRPEGIGTGAERSEADEVRRGGAPGPPASP